MIPLAIFSKRWKLVTVLVVMLLVAMELIAKVPSEAVKAEAALGGVRHLLHDADADRREVRPLPLLG